VSGRQMIATRTFLEMRDPAALRPGRTPDVPFALERMDGCPPALWRFLYIEVGRRYRWIDRLDWTDAEIAAYLADPAVSLWILTVDDQPAGYFELRRDADGGVEIAYLGVIHHFHGQGLGGHLLTTATREAWALRPTRVWVHTSDLDDPAALPNYLARGFQITHTENYIVAI
jgi:GNAT superfamily N-acetyltransferase